MVPPRLTKQTILEGAEARATLHIKEYGADVEIRPLTDGELTKVFGVVGTISLKEDGTPDFSKVDLSKNFEALRLVVSMGMVDPKLTVEEVASMKFGVPEYIAMKVLEMSGVVGADTAKKKDDGGVRS
ncbi:MAG: hypothetical protein QFX35_05085 [Candidatus Verstraetearchaeota archaeon]|nr:hypothetical protein [Candidatus Verstraetearchaeota archaeon]